MAMSTPLPLNPVPPPRRGRPAGASAVRALLRDHRDLIDVASARAFHALCGALEDERSAARERGDAAAVRRSEMELATLREGVAALVETLRALGPRLQRLPDPVPAPVASTTGRRRREVNR